MPVGLNRDDLLNQIAPRVHERLAPDPRELGETMKAVLDVIDRRRPSRIVFDSLSEMHNRRVVGSDTGGTYGDS